MLSRSQAINAVNIYDVTCVRTSRYSAGSSNPQSLARLSIGGWHRISNASQIFSIKWFSTVAMTATLPPSTSWAVSLRCSSTAESVNLVVLECSFERTLKGWALCICLKRHKQSQVLPTCYLTPLRSLSQISHKLRHCH